MELVNQMVILFFDFEELPYCFPQWPHQFIIPPTVYKGSLFSASLPTLLSVIFLITDILTGGLPRLH